jgi:hypothetical protein
LTGLGQEKSFEIGLLFGGSYNSLPNTTLLNDETLRPLGGFLTQYNFTSSFSIKSKILYHVKVGSSRNMILGSGAARSDYLDLHYLTLPILAQLNFGKNKWQFFCNAGGYLGYLMKGELVEESSNPNLDSFNKIDLGIALGSGVSLRISQRLKIFLESSFDYGFGKRAITTSTGITYNFSTKKKTFNGTGALECAEYEESVDIKQKKKTKWRLVLYKDGSKVGGKSKRGKSRLFKNKK